MVQTYTQSLPFEAYVDLCTQTGDRYELVQGNLLPMNPPTWKRLTIAKFLETTFDAECLRLKLPWEAFRESGQRTRDTSSRLPDVMVAPIDAISPWLNQTAILQVPALLVVEIVSPSSATEDYEDKRNEYQAQGIPEYWVVDHDALGSAKHIGVPKLPTLSLYGLSGERRCFRGSDRILSPTFPDLTLTAEQVFRAGR
jgi:Uma2 family endonuclease